jgi:FkbM family methyltransferase
MAISLNSANMISRLRNRGRIEAAQAYLRLRRGLNRGPVWFDHGCVKLPFHGDNDSQEIYYYLDAKPWWEKETQLIRSYMPPGAVAVDVGANLGFMSGILSGLAGPTGHVHSFEPSVVVFRKLTEVIHANNYLNVSAYNMGCGSEEGSMTLYCPASSGNATLRPVSNLQADAKERQSVRIVKLDDFLIPKLERLDFLKIDTEGYEDEVLAGAIELLKRFRPVIYIELCTEYLASSENAVRLLRELGYTFASELVLDKSVNGENYFALPPGFQTRH